MLLKGNISEDALKLLNELSEGCSCVANRTDLLHQICLRNAFKSVENSAYSNVNTFYGKFAYNASDSTYILNAI